MTQDIQTLLHSKLNLAISWVAALTGLGAFAGLVSTGVAVLSGVWLVIQIYGWVVFTYPKNKREKAEWEAKAAKKAVK
jgi:hypothetical protein